MDVVLVWAGSVATGELDGALSLYASSAKVHAGEATFCGRKHLNALLSNCQVEGPAEVAGEDELVVASWRHVGTGGGLTVRSRVEHGLISEQWFGAGPEPAAAGEPQAFQEFPWAVVTRGAVGRDLVDYAWRRLDPVIDTIPEPVWFVKIKLAFAPDPAIERPALAEASIDVDGDLVRAHVTAGQLEEAVDLLQRRLSDQLSHRAERRLALHKSSGAATPGEWRHGDWAPRPEVFDRPLADRELVRRKSFAVDEMTPEEAAFDMEQLDHHFYLFRDLASGEDSLLERETNGYRLTRLHPSDLLAHGEANDLTIDPSIPPTLSVDEAIEVLEATHQSLQFFVDTASGRGAVLYRRYDGHNGLLTLE